MHGKYVVSGACTGIIIMAYQPKGNGSEGKC